MKYFQWIKLAIAVAYISYNVYREWMTISYEQPTETATETKPKQFYHCILICLTYLYFHFFLFVLWLRLSTFFNKWEMMMIIILYYATEAAQTQYISTVIFCFIPCGRPSRFYPSAFSIFSVRVHSVFRRIDHVMCSNVRRNDMNSASAGVGHCIAPTLRLDIERLTAVYICRHILLFVAGSKSTCVNLTIAQWWCRDLKMKDQMPRPN